MKYIIFDLDGTLLDSMYIWKNVSSLYLEKQGIQPPEGMINIVKKFTIPEAARYFIATFSLPFTENEVVESIIDIVADKYRNEIQLKPYALNFIQKQKELGSKMCILTASESSYIFAALERLNLLPYFECILTCTEIGLTKKDPLVYKIAMERLGGNIENTYVFEDALYAVKSAHQGGFSVIAIEDSCALPDKNEIMNLCTRYIQNYNELL